MTNLDSAIVKAVPVVRLALCLSLYRQSRLRSAEIIARSGRRCHVRHVWWVLWCAYYSSELEEASTHKSAKTHAGNVFVTRDLDFWTFCAYYTVNIQAF